MKTGFKKRKNEDLSLNELSIKVHITLCWKKKKDMSKFTTVLDEFHSTYKWNCQDKNINCPIFYISNTCAYLKLGLFKRQD